MEQCLTVEALQVFVGMLDVLTEYANGTITIHATEGPVKWVYNGTDFCIGGEKPA